MNQSNIPIDNLIVEMKELADLYFQDQLSEQQQARLVEILSHSDETQQAYVDHMHDTYYLSYLAEGRVESFESIEPRRSPVLNFWQTAVRGVLILSLNLLPSLSLLRLL